MHDEVISGSVRIAPLHPTMETSCTTGSSKTALPVLPTTNPINFGTLCLSPVSLLPSDAHIPYTEAALPSGQTPELWSQMTRLWFVLSALVLTPGGDNEI